MVQKSGWVETFFKSGKSERIQGKPATMASTTVNSKPSFVEAQRF